MLGIGNNRMGAVGHSGIVDWTAEQVTVSYRITQPAHLHTVPVHSTIYRIRCNLLAISPL
jgi:hypothetical protein